MSEIDNENQELKEQETSRFSGRMRRYARVGSSVGGLAAQVVGARYLGFDLDKGRHSADLKAALGGLKGPLMKAAQILATIPDALPKEYAEELRQLQSNAPPWAGPSSSGACAPSWAKAGRRNSSPSSGKQGPQLPSARCTGPSAWMAAIWPASCSIRTCSPPWKPICSS